MHHISRRVTGVAEADCQQRFGWKPEQWPNAMRLGRQNVSLPLSPKLTDSDVDRVIAAIRAIVSHHPDPGMR